MARSYLICTGQGSFYMRLKFTGKPLLVKGRSGPLYQEKFYMRSKFRCKSVSQLCLGIFMGNFLHHLHLDIGDGVKSSHIDNTSLLASFYMSKLLNWCNTQVV